MDQTNRRFGPDRRRQPRGGRRTTDDAGYAPLVMVIDADDRRREIAEAILAKLSFAVAPVESVAKALSVIQALRPSIVICPAKDVDELHQGLRDSIPIVSMTEQTATPDALLDAVRVALRAAAL